jgi:hypothetical protein
MTKSLSEIAVELSKSGLSVIPTQADKRPAVSEWTSYQKDIPDQTKVKAWFSRQRNIAAIAGKVSGGLEILDFDCQAEALPKWTQYVQEHCPGLVERLIMEASPNGAHVCYRCPEATIPGNSKLARKSIEVEGPGEHSYRGKKFQAQRLNGKWSITPEIIETRGEGGYCLIYPSKGYDLKQGDYLNIPIITAGERNVLIEAALYCNEWTPPQEIDKGYQPSRGGNKKPGEDFDERGDLRGLLEKHGWSAKGHTNDGRELWLRPGKRKGNSATLSEGKIFYVFSSNGQPFEPGKAYGPFGVYALLEHSGDFKEATKALAAQGYGNRVETDGQSRTNAPTMAELREHIGLCVFPGQKFTFDEVCRGIGCYKPEQRNILSAYMGRLCKEGLIKRDEYRFGGYRRVAHVQAYDLTKAEDFTEIDIFLPLDLDRLITLSPHQLLQISGRYDAGKSSFIYQVMADNYRNHKIVAIISEEQGPEEIKDRMQKLGIPLNHPNITIYPMELGFEDLIPSEPAITLIDYIKADSNAYETGAQIQRMLKNLGQGIVIFATQKHPGLDKPVGGQFSVHGPAHVILLDRSKDKFICKIFRTKRKGNLEGYWKPFTRDEDGRLEAVIDTWKPGRIKWEKDAKPDNNKSNSSNNSNSSCVGKRGGPHIYKKKEKERIKEKERKTAGESTAKPKDPGLFTDDFLKSANAHIEGEV